MLKLLKQFRLEINNISNSYKLIKNPNRYFQINLSRNLTKMPRYEYPKVRRDETIVESYHGVEVSDMKSITLNSSSKKNALMYR